MRKTFIIASLTFAVLVTVGGGMWLWRAAHRPPRAVVSVYENDMVEALVRGLLQEYGVRNAPACFLAFGESMTPPSGNFIARFSDCRRPVVRSYSASVSPPIGRHLEISTGRPGLIVQIVSFKEYIPGCFDVVLTISNLPPGHQQIIYRISKNTGEWVVLQRTPT